MPVGDAWRNSWLSHWNGHWKQAVVPPVIEFDTHDGYPNHREEQQQARRRERETLQHAVKRAFHRVVEGEDIDAVPVPVERPATKREIKALAVFLLPDLRTEGLEASLRDIQALLGEMQQAFVIERAQAMERARRKREEEAVLLLMLAL